MFVISVAGARLGEAEGEQGADGDLGGSDAPSDAEAGETQADTRGGFDEHAGRHAQPCSQYTNVLLHCFYGFLIYMCDCFTPLLSNQ